MPMGELDTAEKAYRKLTPKGFSPNPMQLDVWEYMASARLGVGLLGKGPTGSGKTEMIVIPALTFKRRVIMVYPTRSLVDDQIGRLSGILANYSRFNGGRPVSLTIDTGVQSTRKLWINGDAQIIAGNVRRHLYSGNIIITTLDKLLYRFFGFGEEGKGYVFPLRINYGLRKALFCFDEAHSYDDIAFTNFSRLVRMLYEKGRDVVLMTATMPPEKIEGYFDFLDQIDYVDNMDNRRVLDNFRDKMIDGPIHPGRQVEYLPVPIMNEPAEDGYVTINEELLVERIVNEVHNRWQPGQRMIVSIERVEDAYNAWQELRDQYENVLFYHGRLPHEQRQKVYSKLKELDESDGAYLLISTSAIEVGCDLNAHTLITQLCDPDRLVQRAGRCNRRRDILNAQIIVIGDDIPDWLTALDAQAKERYCNELRNQHGGFLSSNPLLECLNAEPQIDQRVQMYFDMLYDYVYDARLENKPLHDKGMIFTRSWEPTITIATSEGEKGLENSIEVPISRFRMKEADQQLDYEWEMNKQRFNPELNRFEALPVGGWECAYQIDVIAMPQPGIFLDYDEDAGWVHLPVLFNGGFTTKDGSKRVLIRDESSNGGDKSQLWYYTGESA